MLEENVLVLSANAWDFEDEKTRERRRGVTVYACHFTSNENGTSYSKGIKPVKYTIPYEEFYKLSEMPLPAYGLFHFNFDYGKGKIAPVTFDLIAPLEVGVLND